MHIISTKNKELTNILKENINCISLELCLLYYLPNIYKLFKGMET